MDKPKNPPAFPLSAAYDPDVGQPCAIGDDYAHGMDLRDYFAAKAMCVTLANTKGFPNEKWSIGVAREAYMMADAMLKVRQNEHI